MRGKQCSKLNNRTEENESSQAGWLNWCRLCAKPQEDDSGHEKNIVLIKDDTGKLDAELVTSIGKYFWVNIKATDEISHSLCWGCKQLIDELSAFTERVNKVQILFCLLQNLKPTTSDQARKLRSQCGLIDEGWQHIIRNDKPASIESHKPLLIDQQVQTDIILLGKDNVEPPKAITETEVHTIEIVHKEDENEEETYESQSDMETEQTYEYILQGENDMEFIESSVFIDENENNEAKADNEEKEQQANGHEVEEECDEQVCEEEEIDEDEVQDSDLFKELKYKPDDEQEEEDEEPKAKKFKIKSKQDDLELEFQDCSQEGEQKQQHEMEMETMEILEEGEEEDEDEDDYINTNEEDNKAKTLLLLKGKRGRPCSKNKNDKDPTNFRYECKECKRKYKNPNIYRKHMKSIHDVVIENLPDFMCSVCNKDCFTESRLKLHMRHHLPDEEKLSVPCPYCDRKFSQVGAMRQHVNGIHHQMKPFICDQCGRACKTMAALTEHKLVHTNECPFECEVCHKRFKNKPRLKSHMDIHTQLLYKCPDCGLELNTKRTLLQHRLVHSEEKRFKCEFCDAAFKRSKALKNHLILHTGLRPYKCNFCDRTFSNGSNCRAHKKRAHPKELAEEEATGKVAERVPIPKLEELKLANGVVVQPRKIKRHSGGLPDHLRKLLQAAEKRKKANDASDADEPNVENFESFEDFHYDIGESEIEETEQLADNPNEECEETVIYEIIDEI